MRTTQAWENLSKALQREKAIMGYRNTSDNLKDIHLKNLTAVKFIDGKIIAFAALWPTENINWFEAGSVWVDKRYRGMKLSSEMFHQLMAIKRPPDSKIFVITHSVKEMMHLLSKENFKKIPAKQWNRNVPSEITCQPCDQDQGNHCHLKGKECKLFCLAD